MSVKSFNEIKKKLFRGKSPDGLPINPGGARIGHRFYTYYVTRGSQQMLVKSWYTIRERKTDED